MYIILLRNGSDWDICFDFLEDPFITDEFNVGSGLGGSNFITINPNASGINQFTLRGSI